MDNFINFIGKVIEDGDATCTSTILSIERRYIHMQIDGNYGY